MNKYNQLLSGSSAERPAEMPWAHHVYHQYTLRSGRRDTLQQALQDQGIQTGIHYALPVHLQPAYANLGYERNSLPQSEKAAEQVLSLPLFPEMTEDQIETVARAVLSER